MFCGILYIRLIKEETKMIDYLSAQDGKLALHHSDRKEVFLASTAQEVADILTTHGHGDSFASSSSMDFADEYGFDTYDGATNLLYAGFDIIHSKEAV